MIRSATPADVPAILAFWNPLIETTAVGFSPTPHTVESLGAMIAARQAEGRAFLVAEIGGKVAGFASYDQFRKGLGYARSMEHTIILSGTARGQGVGRALMAAIEEHARARGVHMMVAGVSAENPAGLAFHSALGYVEAGRIAEAGYKFGRFLDLVLMQKLL